MAENKQLTVAELLARAREENPEGADQAPKRRRRRSLEDGGVSVAELTGSFKAVQAAPAESRHSSVPLDAPASGKPASDKSDAGSKGAGEKGAGVKDAQKPSAKTAEAQKPDAQDTDVQKEAGQRDAKKDRPAPAPTPDTKIAPKGTKDTKAAPKDTKPVEADAAEQSKPSDDDTGVIGKVTDQTPAVKGSAPAAETGEMPQVDTVADPVPDQDSDAGATTPNPFADSRSGSTKASVLGLTDPSPAPVEQAPSDDYSYDEDDDDSGMNLGAVILLALLGIIGGIVIFLGFQFLWANLSAWFVAVAAVVVIALMIGAVKWLRTSSDGLSMTLAGLVGLVITFGPAALALT